ncbi:MAG: hypothetical protein EFT35_02255, partial [Methanophagales archaeon ANME-1-THS]
MELIKKLLIAFGIVVIVCCLVIVLLPRLYYTAVLDIDRLDFEPDHYFELTEEDLGNYQVLREALEEIKKEEKGRISKIIPEEKGVIVYEYLRQRQTEVGPIGISRTADACFKYSKYLYSFSASKVVYPLLVTEIGGPDEPDRYFLEFEGGLKKEYPTLSEALEALEEARRDVFYSIDIERLYEPHYFELTEEDLDNYPLLRKALEGMKRQGEDSISYEVPNEEGYAIFDYLSQKQSEVGPPPSGYV